MSTDASRSTSRPVAVDGRRDAGSSIVDRSRSTDGLAERLSASDRRPTRRIVVAGLLLGIGIGGFVDGIVMHQLLQWHHLSTSHGDGTMPIETVEALRDETRRDGLFHTATWLASTSGLLLLWSATRWGHGRTWRSIVGLLLAGFGLFNVVEGLINHQLLGLHHVRDDLGGPLSWDLGFLGSGVVMALAGAALFRVDRPEGSVRVVSDSVRATSSR